MTGPALHIASWTDLAALTDDMDLLAGQLTSVVRYARRWACQSAGFEPSPLCLLRPLAALMDSLADAFGDLERVALEDWADLRSAVAATSAELRALDALVADLLPAVA